MNAIGGLIMLKVTYLFHSGFTIETDTDYIVIDYFRDNCIKQKMRDCGQLCKECMPKEKKTTFFVTHAHYDHFDKDIFNLSENAYYLLSDDIKINESDRIKVCSPYEKFIFNGLEVETFGSTDEGLSYLLQIEDKCIFHAGDLNWWHWEGETEDEKNDAKTAFINEIGRLIGKKIDIAFFPVDPRLEHAYYYGGKYFIEKIQPRFFVPMHFQDSYTITTKFKNLMASENTSTKIFNLNRRGEVIILS